MSFIVYDWGYDLLNGLLAFLVVVILPVLMAIPVAGLMAIRMGTPSGLTVKAMP